MDSTFKLEQFSLLYVLFDFTRVTLLDSTTLVLKLLLDIGTLLTLYGYFYFVQSIGEEAYRKTTPSLVVYSHEIN